MANNFTAKDASGVTQTFKSTESTAVHTPHRNIDAVVPGSGATNLGKAEDAVHASGDVGVMLLAVRTDTPANKSGTDGDYEPLQISGGKLWVQIRGIQSPNGDAIIDDTADAVKSLLVAGTSVVGYAGLEPRTSGGLSSYRNLDLDETGVNIKASAGQTYTVIASNLHATARRFLKLYDKATAPTVGTDTPKLTLPLEVGLNQFDLSSYGVAFASGIGAGATTALADNDTGAPGANEVVINLFYK